MLLCNGTVVIRDRGVDDPAVGVKAHSLIKYVSSLSPDFTTFPNPLSLSKQVTPVLGLLHKVGSLMASSKASRDP
jgi:hypothetical protein